MKLDITEQVDRLDQAIALMLTTPSRVCACRTK